jgi:Protein of unknown function (DUF4238)
LNYPLDHHYVPRSYFKPWADSNKELIVYERKNNDVLPPYRRSTKSICMIRGLYSYSPDVEASKRNAIEQKLLSRIDNDGARVLQKLYKPNGIATKIDTAFLYSLIHSDCEHPKPLPTTR